MANHSSREHGRWQPLVLMKTAIHMKTYNTITTEKHVASPQVITSDVIKTQNKTELQITFQIKKPNEIPPISDDVFLGDLKCSDKYFGLGKTQAGDSVKTLCLYDHSYAKWRFFTPGVVELMGYYVEVKMDSL